MRLIMVARKCEGRCRSGGCGIDAVVWRWRVVAIVIAAILLGSICLEARQSLPAPPLVTAPTATGSGTGELVRIGYSASVRADVDQRDAKVALKNWLDLTAEQDGAGYVSTIEVYDSLDRLEQDIVGERIDVAVISPSEYIDMRKRCPLEPFSVGQVAGKPTDHIRLVVHADSGIDDVRQLQGKKLLAQLTGTGRVPLLWLDTLLVAAGHPPHRSFFQQVKTAGKAQPMVLPVFFRQADACLVHAHSLDIMVELNPQIGAKLKTVAHSPEFCVGLMAFRSGLKADLKQRLRRSALRLHESIKGQQICILFKVDKVLPWDEKLLDTTIALLEQWQKLGKGR